MSTLECRKRETACLDPATRRAVLPSPQKKASKPRKIRSMSSVIQTAYPSVEPVSLAEMTNYCKVFVASDNDLITDQITAAREWIEDQTGLCLASRNFIQFEDSLPSIPFGFSGYAYSASQNAYFGYGPLTPYPPMGWNPRVNPFEIQIIRNPVTAIDHIEFIDTFGNLQTLQPGPDFVMDLVSTPARVAPLPGQRWNTNVLELVGLERGEQCDPLITSRRSSECVVPITRGQLFLARSISSGRVFPTRQASRTLRSSCCALVPTIAFSDLQSSGIVEACALRLTL